MKPPLPTASNFPFQRAVTGSQTSKLMCESLVGAENATTRQKAFAMVKLAAGPMGLGGNGIERSGGGSTLVAEVTVALGIWSDARLSQDCCADVRAGTNANAARQIKHTRRTRRSFMPMSPEFRFSNVLVRWTYT